MAREKHSLGKERAATGWRYRKMVAGKTWTSKVYPSLTRQTKAEAWRDFVAFRETARASSQKQYRPLLKPDGESLDDDAIVASGLTATEATREVLIQLCRNAYTSLGEVLSNAGDQIGSQEALAKAKILEDNHSLSLSDLFSIYGYASSIPAWKLTRHALPRMRRNRDSCLILEVLAAEFTASYEAKAKNGDGSFGQHGLVKAGLNAFKTWFGEKRSMETFEQTDWKQFSDYLKDKVRKTVMSAATAHQYQKVVGMFLRYISTEYPELTHCNAPNLSALHHRISLRRREPDPFTREEIDALLANATDRTRLYLLLMLNVGMYQQDISDLQAAEIDFTAGRIIRARSKTRKAKKNSQQPFRFNWMLWPTTLELLRRHGCRNGAALRSSHGGSLVTHTTASRNDTIRSAYGRLVTKLKKQGILPSTWNKTLKSLRKTGANIVAKCPDAKISAFFNQYLNHSTVAHNHYLQSGQPNSMFDEAIRYIGHELGQVPAVPTS